MRYPLPPFLFGISVMLAIATAVAQQAAPPVTRTPVILTTRTPLGDARIELPAGSPLDSNLVSDQKVFISRPPFSGWIPVKDTTLVPDPKPASPQPPSEAARSTPLPAQAPASKAPHHFPGTFSGWVQARLIGDGHMATAACLLAFLACGSIIVPLICFLLLGNRCSPAKTTAKSSVEKETAARHAMEIKELNTLLHDEKARTKEEMELLRRTVKQAEEAAKKISGELDSTGKMSKSLAEKLEKEVSRARELEDRVSQQEREIEALREKLAEQNQQDRDSSAAAPHAPSMPDVPCPLCQAPIPYNSLSLGINTCPACRGEFNCE